MSFSPNQFLEIIISELEKQGLLTSYIVEKKHEIINEIAGELGDKFEFSADNLKNQNIQKALMGAIISYSIGDTASLKYFVQTIKDEQAEQEKDNRAEIKQNPELDERLKHGIALMDQLANLPQSPRPRPSGAKVTDELEEKLKKEYPASQKIEEQRKEEMSAYEKEISNGLKNLYGGQDPRFGGEIPSAILGPIIGNLNGLTTPAAPNPQSTAFLIQQKTFKPGVSDPQGLQNALGLLEITLGAVSDQVQALEARIRFKPHGPGLPPGIHGS